MYTHIPWVSLLMLMVNFLTQFFYLDNLQDKLYYIKASQQVHNL